MRLTIDDVAYGGDGVAHDPACGTVFVPGAYMGEIVEAGTAEQIFKHPQKELTQKYLSGVFS